MKRLILIALLGLTTIASAQTPGQKLGVCLYKSMTPEDRALLVQWAYVSLAKTEEAKAIQPIPAEKIRAVSKNAKKAATRLMAGPCAKDALNVTVQDPKKGLQEAVQTLGTLLIQEKLPSLSTDLLSNKTQQAASLLSGLLKK